MRNRTHGTSPKLKAIVRGLKGLNLRLRPSLCSATNPEVTSREVIAKGLRKIYAQGRIAYRNAKANGNVPFAVELIRASVPIL